MPRRMQDRGRGDSVRIVLDAGRGAGLSSLGGIQRPGPRIQKKSQAATANSPRKGHRGCLSFLKCRFPDHIMSPRDDLRLSRYSVSGCSGGSPPTLAVSGNGLAEPIIHLRHSLLERESRAEIFAPSGGYPAPRG